jgi:hypothetical protein
LAQLILDVFPLFISAFQLSKQFIQTHLSGSRDNVSSPLSQNTNYGQVHSSADKEQSPRPGIRTNVPLTPLHSNNSSPKSQPWNSSIAANNMGRKVEANQFSTLQHFLKNENKRMSSRFVQGLTGPFLWTPLEEMAEA